MGIGVVQHRSHQPHFHFTSLHFSIADRTFPSHLLPHPSIQNPTRLLHPPTHLHDLPNVPAMLPPSPPRTPPPAYTSRRFSLASPQRVVESSTSTTAAPAQEGPLPISTFFPTDLPPRLARALSFNLRFYTLPRSTIPSRPVDLEIGPLSPPGTDRYTTRRRAGILQ